MNDIEQFIKAIESKGLICPQPMQWNDFYLKFQSRIEMPKPLILAAWVHCSDAEKSNRFKEQLNLLDKNDLGLEALAFLEGLSISQWHKKQ
mgnify:CR=1 FL=1|tara:strand:+ start:912 stop:1184 length:273 start_codon:yes stop_codon:yes gene_type:complete